MKIIFPETTKEKFDDFCKTIITTAYKRYKKSWDQIYESDEYKFCDKFGGKYWIGGVLIAIGLTVAGFGPLLYTCIDAPVFQNKTYLGIMIFIGSLLSVIAIITWCVSGVADLKYENTVDPKFEKIRKKMSEALTNTGLETWCFDAYEIDKILDAESIDEIPEIKPKYWSEDFIESLDELRPREAFGDYSVEVKGGEVSISTMINGYEFDSYRFKISDPEDFSKLTKQYDQKILDFTFIDDDIAKTLEEFNKEISK